MNNFSCGIPRIEFGKGSMENIGKYVSILGKRAFLVIDPFVYNSPEKDLILGHLEKEGVETEVFFDVQTDPDTTDIDKTAKIGKNFNADVVIGIGGGSSIDFAKGVAIMAKNPGSAWEYTRRIDHVAKIPGDSTLPVVAVPTTAGTGSEATPFSVLSNKELNEKSTIVDSKIIPKIAIVDPELTYSMPQNLTALTGVDALSHAVEAFINKTAKSNIFAQMVSREAMSLVGKYLIRAYKNGGDSEARDGMSWASCLAGMAIAHANPTLPHALGQAIGGFAHIPHGASIAVIFAEIINRSYRSDIKSFSEIACLLNPDHNCTHSEELAKKAGYEISSLLEQINCSPVYSDFGVKKSDLPHIAKIALNNYITGISQHPFEADAETIIDIFESCL